MGRAWHVLGEEKLIQVPLVSLRTTWKNYWWMWDHINVNLKEAGLDSVNFIYLAQEREK